MELFEKVLAPNDLVTEVIEKAKFYRNDPYSAKIRPE